MQGSQEGKRAKLWGPRAHFGANTSVKILYISWLSFSVSLSLSCVASAWLPFAESISFPSSSLSDKLSTLLSFSAVFLLFRYLFSFSIKSLTTLSTPNSVSPFRNVFSAQGLVTSSLCGGRTYSTSSAMFVEGIMRLCWSNCPRRVQNRKFVEV